MILHNYIAEQIACEILGIEEGDPAPLEKALQQRNAAHERSLLLIKQMSAIGDATKPLPRFHICPNCQSVHDDKVTHCAVCHWPPIPK